MKDRSLIWLLRSPAYSNTFRIISDYELSADKLEYLQWQLKEIYGDDTGFDPGAERAFLYDFVQCTFTDDGKGSGRPMKQALVTVVAIKHYEKDKNAYPASLDELVGAGYLKALPLDPYGGGPLRYKVVGDDFVLYSFGADMKDDGGRLETENGKPFKWSDDGDWVFWPVE